MERPVEKISSVCVAAALSLLLAGCVPGSAVPAVPPTTSGASAPGPSVGTTPPSIGALTADQQNGLDPPADFFESPYVSEGARVFDFAELTPYFFRCDPCTIDSIIAEYGDPDELFGQVDEAPNVWVELHYPKLTISVTGSGDLSFAHATDNSDADGLTKYPLTAEDRALSMSGLSVETTDSDAPLPRGLRVGTSTRDQVAAAYPAGSALLDENGEYGNTLCYAYVWFDDLEHAYSSGGYWIGGMDYEFDAANMLISASVSWTVLSD